MKREDLFAAIGELEDALLDENTEHISEARSGRRWAGFAAAACLMLCLGAGAALLLPRLPSGSGTAAPTEASAEASTEPLQAMTGTFVRYELVPEGGDPYVMEETEEFVPYIELNEITAEFRIRLEENGTCYEGTYTLDRTDITATAADGSHVFSITQQGSNRILTLVDGSDEDLCEQRQFSAWIHPSRPFAELQSDDLAYVEICGLGEGDRLEDADRAYLEGILRELTIYQEDTPAPYGYLGDGYVTGVETSFRLHMTDSTQVYIAANHTLVMDDKSYIADLESFGKLANFSAEIQHEILKSLTEEEESKASADPCEYLGAGTHYRLDPGSAMTYHDTPEAALPVLSLQANGRFTLALDASGKQNSGSYQENGTQILAVFDGGPEMELRRMEDPYLLELVTYPDHPELEHAMFSARIDHWLPFETLDAQGILNVEVMDSESGAFVTLSPAQIGQMAPLLQGITVVQRDTSAKSYSISYDCVITGTDGSVTELSLYAGGMLLNGRRYHADTDAISALLRFCKELFSSAE